MNPQQYAKLPLPQAQQEPRSGGPSSPNTRWQQLLTQQEAQQLQARQQKQAAQLAAQKLKVCFACPLLPVVPVSIQPVSIHVMAACCTITNFAKRRRRRLTCSDMLQQLTTPETYAAQHPALGLL